MLEGVMVARNLPTVSRLCEEDAPENGTSTFRLGARLDYLRHLGVDQDI